MLSLVTIAVGVTAIVMTAGAATPLVVGACVVGSCTAAYGASNLYEAGHNIYLGSVGDGLTVATNPLRDTLFMGNDRLYHQRSEERRVGKESRSRWSPYH